MIDKSSIYVKIYQICTIFISSDVTIYNSSVTMFFVPIGLSLHFLFHSELCFLSFNTGISLWEHEIWVIAI